jgi:hypothetical protein
MGLACELYTYERLARSKKSEHRFKSDYDNSIDSVPLSSHLHLVTVYLPLE